LLERREWINGIWQHLIEKGQISFQTFSAMTQRGAALPDAFDGVVERWRIGQSDN